MTDVEEDIMTGIGRHNPNANKPGHTPVGLTAEQVSYVIEKLKLKGLDYISGILIVPDVYADKIDKLMKPYPKFKAQVEKWLRDGDLGPPIDPPDNGNGNGNSKK